MKLLSPTEHRRLNEVTGFLQLSLGLVILLSLVSYHAQDPSWNTATDSRPLNLIGYPGSHLADVLLQVFGAAAFLIPFFTFLLAWKWIRSEPLQAGAVKVVGFIALTTSLCSALSFAPVHLFDGSIRIGGTLGYLIFNALVDSLNLAGALLLTVTVVIVSIYLVSTFTISKLAEWSVGPLAWLRRRATAWSEWRERMRRQSIEKARERAAAPNSCRKRSAKYAPG